jgi:nitroreductase
VTVLATRHRRSPLMPDAFPLTDPLVPHPTTSTFFTAHDLLHCLETRRSVKPVALGEPGPSPDELRRLLTIASRVPDHGSLVPWRFILFQGEARQAASAQLAALYLAQNPEPSERTLDRHAKISQLFTQAPLVVAIVSCADPNARKPEWEQVLTVGAVCMNLIAAANALGYASVWLTGWAAYDGEAMAALGVRPEEKVAGFVHIGTARERPPDRPRPHLDDLITHWTPAWRSL